MKSIHSVGETVFPASLAFRQAVLQTLSSSKKHLLAHHWGLDSTWESLTDPHSHHWREPLHGASRHLVSHCQGLISYLTGT